MGYDDDNILIQPPLVEEEEEDELEEVSAEDVLDPDLALDVDDELADEFKPDDELDQNY